MATKPGAESKIPGRILDNLRMLREAFAREASACSGLHHILVAHNDDLSSDVLYGPGGFVSSDGQHGYMVTTPERGPLNVISIEGMVVLQPPEWTDRGKQYHFEPLTFNWTSEARRAFIAKPGVVANGFVLAQGLNQEISHRSKRFESLTGDVMRCLDRIANHPQLAVVVKDEPLNRASVRASEQKARWMRIVHRLGWKNHFLSLMGAIRQTWLRIESGSMMYLPYDSEHLAPLLDLPVGPLASLKGKISIPPDRFVSELAHDVFTESAYAIDDILTLATGNTLEQGSSGAEGQSNEIAIPREHVFVSYSHADEASLKEILTMLTPAVRDRTIKVWYDRNLKPGDAWRREIDQAMSAAAVGLLLVSGNFLESEFINNHELPYLLKASVERGVRLLWVSVGHCLHESTELTEIQSLNDPSKPLKDMTKQKRTKEIKRICQFIIKHYEDAKVKLNQRR